MKISEEQILLYNIIKLIGWCLIIAMIVQQTKAANDEIETILNFVRIVTISQVFEVIFIKPNQLTSNQNMIKYSQFLIKLLFQWYFMRPKLCFCSFRNTISGWAFTEILLSIYYLSSKQELFAQVNKLLLSFTIPFTTIGMVRVINRVIESNQSSIIFDRLVQLLIGVFTIINLIAYWKKKDEKLYKLKSPSRLKAK